jgi:hypothetical protein
MFAALNGVFGSKVTNNEALQMNHYQAVSKKWTY